MASWRVPAKQNAPTSHHPGLHDGLLRHHVFARAQLDWRERQPLRGSALRRRRPPASGPEPSALTRPADWVVVACGRRQAAATTCCPRVVFWPHARAEQVELPAYVVLAPAANQLGRRRAYTAFLLVCASALVALHLCLLHSAAADPSSPQPQPQPQSLAVQPQQLPQQAQQPPPQQLLGSVALDGPLRWGAVGAVLCGRFASVAAVNMVLIPPTSPTDPTRLLHHLPPVWVLPRLPGGAHAPTTSRRAAGLHCLRGDLPDVVPQLGRRLGHGLRPHRRVQASSSGRPSWRGHIGPPRAPQTAFGGLGLLYALGRRGLPPQTTAGSDASLATGHPSHLFLFAAHLTTQARWWRRT